MRNGRGSGKKKFLAFLLAILVVGAGVLVALNLDVVMGWLGKPSYSFDLQVNDAAMGTATVDAKDPVPGTVMHLKAEASYGYAFDGWYENGVKLSAEKEYEYIMPDKHVKMVATFKKATFRVQVTSMNPGFTGSIDGNYEYLSEITVKANAITGTDFIAWFADAEVYSINEEIKIKVDKDIVLYAEYYTPGAVEIYSWPTAEAAAVGTPLSEVALTGGKTSSLGYFKWANPETTVYENGEYIVMFVPFATYASEAETMITVPIADTVLKAPTISIDSGKLSWNAVENAEGYSVQIGDVSYAVSKDKTSYDLPTKMGEYFVSVSAVGNGTTTVNSPSSNIERYVPAKPSIEDLDYGQAKSEYDENEELVKFGGTVEVTPENFDIFTDDNVIFNDEGFTFDIEVDVSDYLSATTKRKVLDLNKFNITTDVKVVLKVQIKVIDPTIYAEIDTNFPFRMQDLAFGVSYTTMVTTILDISVNGEFVEPELRRGTLHLLFLELVGLEEPLYKWAKVDFQLHGTPLQIEFALCFDAVGAIAASLTLEHIETTNYSAAMYAIKDGEAIFVPYFNKETQSNVTDIRLAGELDVSLNCVRLSASLQIVKGEEVISVLRLNLDAANIESDLSGEIDVEFDTTNPLDPDVDYEGKVYGSYYFYGQVTFEFYFEIRLNFSFLPIDDFGIKLLDGSLIIAEWEYAKGGIPKTPYKDEAIHLTTPIFATDGEYEYYINLEGDLIRVENGKDYLLAPSFADLDSEEIVDIDDHYIYVLSGTKLRRIGRAAGTERTVLMNVARVVGSDRLHIYYTTAENPGQIRIYYRSDMERAQSTYLRLPTGYTALGLRYDYLRECTVIDSTYKDGTAYYFTYDGVNLIRHSGFEHANWENTVYANGSVAYYRVDAQGNIKECFIRGTDKGVTHADNALSIGISSLGIFAVIEKEGEFYDYELGLYPLGKASGAYQKIAEVNDPNAANRIVDYDGEVYFTDLDGEKLTVYKTNGVQARVVAISDLDTAAKNTAILDTEIHGDWLFLYEDGEGSVDVIYSIDVYTLDTAPYIACGNVAAFDKGAPADVSYTLGGNLNVLGVFINKYNEEEFKKLTEDVKNSLERWNSVASFLDENFEFWKGGTVSADDVVSFMNQYGDFFFPLDITVEKFATEGDYLGNLTATIAKEGLASYSYGVHSGYIVTTMGIFEIRLNVVDSRTPVYSQDIVPTFDKGAPTKLSFEILLYDSAYTLDGVPADAYEVRSNNGYYTFTFYPHFLSTLDYGAQSIVLKSEGESFAFELLVEDSRTPKDSTYRKYFDLTYPKNVVFSFDLFDEKFITKVEGNGIPANGAYSVSEDGTKLTLLGRYLNTLTPGEYVFTLTTAEKSFEVNLVVIRSLPPVASESVTHDMGLGNDLVIGFERNDAVTFDVYVDGNLLAQEYWRYSFVTGSIQIDNDYLLSNREYGKMSVIIRSTLYSGDDIKSHVNAVAVTLTDSRTPFIPNSEIIYVIPDSDPVALSIPVLIYGGKVTSVVADGSVSLPFTVYREDLYRRSAVIQINSVRIIDVLAEGEHTLEVTIDGVAHVLHLTVRDERLPKTIGTSSASFNIDYPVAVSYIIRMYGERFVALYYGSELLPDEAYSFVRHSDHSIYHVLVLNEAYLVSLGLGYSETVKFTVVTNVNSFEITLVTEMDPSNPAPEEPIAPPPYQPVDVATSITLTPGTVLVDKANPVDVALTPNYGSNNAFGSLWSGGYQLVEGADYTIAADGTIILRQSFVRTLTSYGNHTVTLRGAKGKSTSVILSVYDSRAPYVEAPLSFEYDRFEQNTISFDAVLYDSKIAQVRVGDTVYTVGISARGSTIVLKDAFLDALALGENVAYIGFNDTASEIAVTLIARDTGLYLSDASTDKAVYADDAATLTLPWTLYEGNVDGCTSSTLTVVSFDNTSVTLAGFFSAAYGDHELSISANGREFTLSVNVYDSRRPFATEALYTFDKGAYEYSLDPSITKNYDLRVMLELYDNQIQGLDMFANQTIRGNGIDYKDYEKDGNDYLISYLFLYRLADGDYTFYISTTDGDVAVNVRIIDSRAPYLKGESPFTYDFAAGEDLNIEMFLYGDDVSSLSFIDIVTGNRITLVKNRDFVISSTEEGTTLTLLSSLFANGFYDSYAYRFDLVSVTERTLTFEVKIENGPRRPFKITYYSVPWKEGEPEYTIESLTLYEGDMIPMPETPAYNYYKFLGFYTERTGGSLFDFSKPVSSDCDIFLHWEPMTYKITLISDDGVIGTYNVKYLSAIPSIPNPTKAGYTFIKWSMDAEHEIRFNLSGETMPHNDITLYAEWQINQYTVIFKDKAGVVLKEEVLYAYESATPPLDEDMQIEHYIFKGWDKSYTSVLADTVCVAVYEAVKYDIGYNLNGGSLPSGAPLTYTIEGGVRLPTPYLTGYDFLGWYKDEAFSGSPVTAIDYGTLPGFTVYARFEVATYDVYLNSTVGGVTYDIFGAPEDNKLRITFEDEYSLPRVLVPNGCFFLGWFSGQNGTGTRFADYLGNSETPWSYAGNITLYAHVVSLLDFTGIRVDDASVNFGLSPYSGAEITLTAVTLYNAGALVDSIPAEELAAWSYAFSDLFVETAYEVRVTYTYTIPGVEGVRESYTSAKIKIMDDAYPSTVIGNTVAEIQIGSDLFSEFTVDGVSIMSGEESVGYATVYYPGNAYSYLSDGKNWIYIVDLLMNTAYEVRIEYHYTLANYDGVYVSTVIVPFTTGSVIPGVLFPVASATSTRVSDGNSGNYDYYTYNVAINFTSIYIENNVHVTGWELLRDSVVVTSGSFNYLLSGNSTSHSVRLSRSNLSDGTTYQIRFTYTYDLQDGLGMQTSTVVHTFTADTEVYDDGGCLVEGTEILMADGSVKNIEDVKLGELVLVWNFYTGTYDVAPVYLIHAMETDQIFYLTFANGKRVGVGLAHGFFVDGKFVTVDCDNATDFIGRSFLYEENGNVYTTELLSVEYAAAPTAVYALATAKHYNHFANGFCGMIPYTGLVNVFDYDGLKYDAEAMAKDLEIYGYMDYSFWAPYISKEQFDAFAGEYMSVAIGKGYITTEDLIDRIRQYFENDEIEMLP